MFFGFLRKRSVTKPSSSGTKTFTSKIKASPSPSSSWESSSASLSLFHHRSHCLGPTRELFCLPSQLPRVNPFDLGDEAYAGDSQLHSLDRGQDEGWFLNTWLQASRLKGAHEQTCFILFGLEIPQNPHRWSSSWEFFLSVIHHELL